MKRGFSQEFRAAPRARISYLPRDTHEKGDRRRRGELFLCFFMRAFTFLENRNIQKYLYGFIRKSRVKRQFRHTDAIRRDATQRDATRCRAFCLPSRIDSSWAPISLCRSVARKRPSRIFAYHGSREDRADSLLRRCTAPRRAGNLNSTARARCV